jgi:hypothetical protein
MRWPEEGSVDSLTGTEGVTGVLRASLGAMRLNGLGQNETGTISTPIIESQEPMHTTELTALVLPGRKGESRGAAKVEHRAPGNTRGGMGSDWQVPSPTCGPTKRGESRQTHGTRNYFGNWKKGNRNGSEV